MEVLPKYTDGIYHKFLYSLHTFFTLEHILEYIHNLKKKKVCLRSINWQKPQTTLHER